VTYLLDTSSISDIMRADPRAEQWLSALSGEDRVVTCPIVRGEILFGIARLPEGRRREELKEKAELVFATVACEPMPSLAGDCYARTKVARLRSGLGLDENDLWIAATAIALNATLVSRDDDFQAIGGLSVFTLR
jgi:predicted nucleic acid-binding protein